MFKLALNGVYGDSNNHYSPLYDPQYTMSVTINGQLTLLMLADRLLKIPTLQVLQVNTDGIVVKFDKEYMDDYNATCKQWEKDVKLELEYTEYQRVHLRDVNNYLCVTKDGKVKRKGAYEYVDLDWHKNHSSLVIQKTAEAKILRGVDTGEFIRNHKDVFDFMLRVKVPRSSKLVLRKDDQEHKLQNICRYYVSMNGGDMVKIMPPTKGKDEDREFNIELGWKVTPCNNMKDFADDIDYDYYIKKANELAFVGG